MYSMLSSYLFSLFIQLWIFFLDANGAIIHYHPVEGQSAPITNTSIYLVDSGGQYLTGTTDVTRTIHLGEPTLEQKNCYTTVLKAHIALAMQVSDNLFF